MGRRIELEPPDLWIIQVLRTAMGWVTADKLVAVLSALKLNYPMPGVSFTQRNGTFWSPEVEEVLRRLVSQGLAEESRGAYRLTKKGNKLAEKALPNSGWTLPYADIVFYLQWDVGQLVEYVSKQLSRVY